MNTNGRIAFSPSPVAREYFEKLRKRLTTKRGLGVRVTKREAFDRMMEFALAGEAINDSDHAAMLRRVIEERIRNGKNRPGDPQLRVAMEWVREMERDT